MSYRSMIAAVAAGARPSSFDPLDKPEVDFEVENKIADMPQPFHHKIEKPKLPDFSAKNLVQVEIHTSEANDPKILIKKMVV